MSISSSYPLIQKLISFQSSFLNIVHSQVLALRQTQQRKQALLKFQILRIGDKNEIFNEILVKLKKQLIEDKQQADPLLKNCFLKLLDLDYLPFLHINRYELTKLAIYGFDIYVDPLEAILQILNRIQRIFYVIEQSSKEDKLNLKLIIQQTKSPWQILLMGWKSYYCFLQFYKLSLNIYMLQEYIQTAGTSLFKKDKQIIFTGVYSIYTKLIPRLRESQLIGNLLQLADLNNIMYSFHGSFDYFLFYTYLTPTKIYYKVFEKTIELQKKCRNTNILTPLLFGLLKNYRAFVEFVKLIDCREYVHLLRVLLSGLIINFKLRILEYNQLLELIELTIIKLSLLKGMKLQIITGGLANDWREAKQFFISAFKSGYNIGEIQTWNLCEVETIQPRIIEYLIRGLLLSQNSREDPFIIKLDKQQLRQVLANEIKELTDGKETLSSLMNNWKQLTNHQKQRITSLLPTKIHEQRFDDKSIKIVRITNILNILQDYSEKLIFAILSFMKDISSQDRLVQQALIQASETLNYMITVINRKESISNLKDIMFQFHMLYPPQSTFEDIVPVYLHCFITREGIGNLIDIVARNREQNRSVLNKQILTCLIHKFCPKPSKDKFQTFRSFQKQYRFPLSVMITDSSMNSVVSNLVKIVISPSEKQTIALQILQNLLSFSPIFVIGVMNLPVMISQKIQSFISWIINSDNQKFFRVLIHMLSSLKKYSQKTQSFDLKQYLNECFFFSVLDQITACINKTSQTQKWEENDVNVSKTLKLINLFVQIKTQFLTQQKQGTQETDQTIERIQFNLLEILSQIIENSQLKISTLVTSCRLYWKIMRSLQNFSITQWYQKIFLNLIFSTFPTENLQIYKRFRKDVLIGNFKNYMIPPQTKGINEQKNKQNKKDNYGFVQIKDFFSKIYRKIDQVEALYSEQNIQLVDLTNIANNATKDIRRFKISSNLQNQKCMLPSLTHQKLSKIYQAYVKSEQNKTESVQKSQIQFCLHLLSLNGANHKILWQLAKANHQHFFLQKLIFTRETISHVLEIFQMLKKTHIMQHAQETPQETDSLIETKMLKILGIELLSKNVNDLEALASSYYFDSSKVQIFVQKQSFLWFLIVCNNSNWREFNQAFSSYMKSKFFLSTLSQYKEFISITKKANCDYQKKVQQFSQLLRKYTFYIQRKNYFIDLLKLTDTQKQNQIRRSTLIINIEVLLVKCEFQKILQKLPTIIVCLHQNSLPDSKFQQLLISVHQLNKVCNYLLGKNIKLPTFMYHNLYLSLKSGDNQLSLGRWIEKVQRVFPNQFSDSKQVFKFIPKKELFTIKDDIEEFLDQTTDMNSVLILKNPVENQVFQTFFTKLKEELKDLISFSDQIIQIKLCPQFRIDSKVFIKMYKFGYMCYIKQIIDSVPTSQERLKKMSPLLTSLINREAIGLENIKQKQIESYHRLKLILLAQSERKPDSRTRSDLDVSLDGCSQQNKQNQVQKKQIEQEKIYFMWGQKQLVEGGQSIEVKAQNKSQYIDLVAEIILGQEQLQLNRHFALGYLNGSFIEQKE